MTQPQQGQLIVCQVCGVPRINGPWLYLGVPKLALVSIQADQLKPCPVCVLLAAVAEMRDHIIAIEKEMVPDVEEAGPTVYEAWVQQKVEAEINGEDWPTMLEFAQLHPELPPDPRWLAPA